MDARITKKNKEEKIIMQEAADLACMCMKYIGNYLKLGVTEISLKKKIIKWFRDHNCSGVSFDPIVAFGPNSANPHHKPNNTKLSPKDVVVIDIGCVYKKWCSDLTRTFLPIKKTKFQEKIYNIVLKANKLAIKNAKNGMKANQLDKIARDVISKAGYGKYFIHTTGHGIGKVVHECPRIGPNDETILTNGMYFTIEPGIYLKNKFGVRIEDTVCFADNKLLVLTNKVGK